MGRHIPVEAESLLVELQGTAIVEQALGASPVTGGMAYDGTYFYLRGGLNIFVYTTAGTLVATLPITKAYDDITYDPFSDSLLAVGSVVNGFDVLNKSTGAIIETIAWGAYLTGTAFTSIAIDRYYNRIYLTRATPPRIYVLSAAAFLYVKFINNPFLSTDTALIPATMITALDGVDRSKIWVMYKSFPPLMGRIDGAAGGNKIDAYRLFGTTFDQSKAAINIRFADNLLGWFYWGNMEDTYARLYLLENMPVPTTPFVMPTAPAFDQDVYRWYQNDNAENPTPMAAENTPLTGTVFLSDVLRLRSGYEETAGSTLPYAGRVVLQYSRDGITYADVGAQADTTQDWRYYDGMGTDGNPVVNLLLSNTTVRQYFVESIPSVSCLPYRNPDRGEFDFCIEAYNPLPNQDYYFRARTWDHRIDTITQPARLTTGFFGSFYVTGDTYIIANTVTSQAATNYGADGFMTIQPGQIAVYRRRALLQFDVSAIPPGTVIASAHLRIYYYQWTNNDPVGRTHNVHRITAAWNEMVVTWNTQPAHDAAVSGSYVVPAAYGWINIDITALVQDWVDGTHPNHGVMIMDSAESTAWGRTFWIYSKEGSMANRARLYITY